MSELRIRVAVSEYMNGNSIPISKIIDDIGEEALFNTDYHVVINENKYHKKIKIGVILIDWIRCWVDLARSLKDEETINQLKEAVYYCFQEKKCFEYIMANLSIKDIDFINNC